MISGDMLASVDEVLFQYATMSHTDRAVERGVLAKMAIMKFGTELTKQRLLRWNKSPTVPNERLATEVSLNVIKTSKSGHSHDEGANGPGAVADDPHTVAECPPA